MHLVGGREDGRQGAYECEVVKVCFLIRQASHLRQQQLVVRDMPNMQDNAHPSDGYEPQQIESTAQLYWDQQRAYEVTENASRPKFYCLCMLPYPSGSLHMGHVRNYTIGDTISRFQRMNGKNVLQPMGWDAFGLPAENAAIKHATAPATWTRANIEHMREQLKSMGYAIDWSREFATCDPEYYAHEQRMFVRLMKQGIAYRKHSVVNWDPLDQTVLANEQVIDGRGWRTGALVEKREIPQWFLKITDYAQELLDGLDRLPEWPEAVKTMQRNWIGRSEGLEISFDVVGEADALKVFTTRSDTLMGVTFLSIAADHPLARQVAASKPQLAAFLDQIRSGGTSEAELEVQEKRGMATGLHAIHPVTGDQLPIWVANFVLMNYGTGAVMAVPGHDERDFEFATQYGLPIRQVIAVGTEDYDTAHWQDWYADKTRADLRVINSGMLDGMDHQQACDAVAEMLERDGKAQRRINYRLRDWGVSRQRYWGCPIPVIRCPACGDVPVPEDQLPVLLPEELAFSGVHSPLKTDLQWRQTTCPVCGVAAERETDTFDTFMESSWYYARHTSSGAKQQVDGRANYWLPIDQYVGGIEHAILHLLYFRFYHKLLRDAGLVSADEPATRLLCQGMVTAETFYREQSDGSKDWINPSAVTIQCDDKMHVVGAVLKSDAQPVTIGGIEKMSKSKNNGVDPCSMVARYGADTVRLFIMFAAPPEHALEWNEAGVEGMARFLRRFWREVVTHASQPPHPAVAVMQLDVAQKNLRRQLHEAIRRVSDDLGRRHSFNTAIAVLMELLNTVSRFTDMSDQGRALRHDVLETMVLLLNPVAPHISHHLWQVLGHPQSVLDDQPWPKVDEAALVRADFRMAVQVNGKLRANIEVSSTASHDDIEQLARAHPNVVACLDGKRVRRVIVVPGRIVNIVAG